MLFEYEFIVLGYRSNTKFRIYETLNARPWVDDDCAICREVGIETIIFRGNNRNRRRGFHNSYVFYQMFKKRVNNFKNYLDDSNIPQRSLFESD